jgi:hypothetical protein
MKKLLVTVLGLILIASSVAIVAGLWVQSLSGNDTTINPTPTPEETPSSIPTLTSTPSPTESSSPTSTPIPSLPVPTMQINSNKSVTITVPFRNSVTYLLPWYSNPDTDQMIFYYGIDPYNSTYLDIRSPDGFPDQGFSTNLSIVQTALWGDQITVLEVYPTYLVVQVEHPS